MGIARQLGVVTASVLAWLALSGLAAAEEQLICIRDAEVGLLRSPRLDAEVVRTALQGETLTAVTTYKDYYLVRDEESDAFLYVPFGMAEELGVELPENILVSGHMPMPHRQDLSYWQVVPSDQTDELVLRSRSGDGMLVAHNGKRYPASYDYNHEYQPVVDGSRLVREAMAYLGAPYVLGGTEESGIDCSGLTRVCLASQGVDVVHRASLQALEGRYIESSRLRPGDLVFFRDDKTPRYLSHVGIFVGRGKFIHASESRGGVVITSLGDKYFKSHYAFARRL